MSYVLEEIEDAAKRNNWVDLFDQLLEGLPKGIPRGGHKGVRIHTHHRPSLRTSFRNWQKASPERAKLHLCTRAISKEEGTMFVWLIEEPMNYIFPGRDIERPD